MSLLSLVVLCFDAPSRLVNQQTLNAVEYQEQFYVRIFLLRILKIFNLCLAFLLMTVVWSIQERAAIEGKTKTKGADSPQTHNWRRWKLSQLWVSYYSLNTRMWTSGPFEVYATLSPIKISHFTVVSSANLRWRLYESNSVVETQKEGTEHTALRATSAQNKGKGKVQAKSENLRPVVLKIPYPGISG